MPIETDYDHALSKRASVLAEEISQFVNSTGHKGAKVLGTYLTKDHRTLQQMKMAMVLAFLDQLAEDRLNGYYDQRNEAACNAAHKMLFALDSTERYMPLI